MYEKEILKYKSLNRLAESDGIVIFGGSQDISIPLGELKQAFALNNNIYNRSFTGLAAADAAKLFRECIAELCPDTVLLHIGDTDLPTFDGSKSAFESDFRTLIGTIREKNEHCRMVIVSQKNYDNNPIVTGMNALLKHIADTEECGFEDISAKYGRNVKNKSELMSFLYDIGFDSPLNIRRPVYDLVRILFSYEG